MTSSAHALWQTFRDTADVTSKVSVMAAVTRDLIRLTAVGTLFTTLYGAPLYALAAWKGLASWYVAATIGVAPAVALLPLLWTEPVLTFAIGGCGLMVALLTHLSMRSNPASLVDAFYSRLRAARGAAKRRR